ncbi:unnamed protein product [Paramecium pentaurelia]|uniref:Kinesin-like protein n=1 Tax=Paramecium pentaurelia TaxID=43138 RepID=A0A8S1YB37_9CILI|nr:unnamed protein product [Paramecium pentaurelia]
MEKELKDIRAYHLKVIEDKLIELITHKNRILAVQSEEIGEFKKSFNEFKPLTQVIQKTTRECLQEFQSKLDEADRQAIQQFHQQQDQLEYHANRLNQQQNQMQLIQELFEQQTKQRLQISEMQKVKERMLNELQQTKEELEQKKFLKQQLMNNFKLSQQQQIQLQQELKDTEHQKRYWNNLLQEAKGNIRVYCRIRPNSQEDMLLLNGECTLVLRVPERFLKSTNCQKESSFNFEHIFNQEADQQEIYNELSDLVQNVVDGHNVCIFAYGQTGSGKTYTMQGDDYNKGVIPRAVEQIFQERQGMLELGWQTTIRVGFQEIYNEQSRDLITNQKCDDVKLLDVKDIVEVAEHFNTAKKNRQVAETLSNEVSSRSHFIFQLNLQGHLGDKQINSTLNLIDLAGSERANVAKTEGDRFTETKAINKSLSALGDVFNALYTKQQHVPFRNSKLTFSLYKYMEGSSKTLMMVNISSRSEDFQQTLASLRFAEKVKSCQMKK